ncbi:MULTISPECIES: hypothetical protein [unclassified Nocardioides]|uniref:hypothetical protein n=1 Tax=unclassified Nocardioides TaxID=2615069 RepID=UPI0006FC4930|nr:MULTISPECIES: hypothetical protein [unclassified Nocardioides]KRA31026.1 hypothetical protein ASD81_16140 [Nocardioides sp. Root614]KRA87647.1 hypothetical protein ASD84_16415 [Nocardioides sp. Root682]
MTSRSLAVLGLGLSVALAVVGQSSSAMADGLTLPPIPALRGVPIPSLPTDLLVPSYVGSPATPQPIAHPPIPQNPHLADNGRSSMHNDSYSSDAYSGSGPLGKSPRVTSAMYGVRECATVTFDSRGRIEALCGGLDGFTMMLIDPTTLTPMAELPMPGRNLLSASNPLTDLCGGSYFVLTADDRALALTTSGEIWEVVQTGESGLAKERSWPLATHLADPDDCLVALTLDWAGRAWFFTQSGVVGTLDLATGAVHTLSTTEDIFNSVSADETGGVYAVTTHATYRFDAAVDGTPTVTWRETYDRGNRTKPGQLSQGSGTSPTLIGDRWIAVTDNAEPRMNVLVYDRRTGVTNRLHCTTPVFGDGASATENSLVAAGNSVMVENNYGYTSPLSTLLGRSTTAGISRVMIEDGGCPVAWTNNSVAPTSVAKASLGNGLLYAYTKPPRRDTLDAWYLTAIDIRTGKTAWSKLTGTGIQWNNHYAAIYLGPDGAAYIATLTGMVRLKDRP